MSFISHVRSGDPPMRVLVIALVADKPSTRLRILPLVERLRQRGHYVGLIELPSGPIGRLGLLRQAASHDVVLLQKKLFPRAFVALLQRANPQLIFDVDDAVMFHELERGQALTGRFFQRFCTIARASLCVVAGNGFIAEHARAARPRSVDDHGVVVLPTPIDTDMLTMRPPDDNGHSPVIGWIGTKGNLRQLLPLAAALRDVAATVPRLHLRLVADATIDIPGVRVDCKAWRADEELADLHGFDIGIMPLEDSLWNRGKGGYKLLQYMAAGLPAVASPVGINSEIVRDGENGYLAHNADTWRTRLLQLAQDADLRHRIGQAARTTVVTQFSLSRYLDRYCQLIESCRP